jgi:carbon starvation protein
LLRRRTVGSAAATGAIAFFAFYEIDGRAAGLVLWQLFGTTNQVLGGLTLLAVTVHLIRKRRNYWVTLVPMVGLMGTTLVAMLRNIGGFWRAREIPLLVIGLILVVLALCLVVEGGLRLWHERGRFTTPGPEA